MAQEIPEKALEFAKLALRESQPKPKQDVTPEPSTAKGVTKAESPTRVEPEIDAQVEERQAEKPVPSNAVPYDRFSEVIEQRNKAMAELERLRAESQERVERDREQARERAIEAVIGSEKPEGFDDWSLERQNAWTANQIANAQIDARLPAELVAPLKELLVEHHVSKTLPDLDRRQLDAVSDIVRQFGGRITPDRAITLARAERPELFVSTAGEAEVLEEASSPPQMPASLRQQAPGRNSPKGAPSEAQKGSDALRAVMEARPGRDRVSALAQVLKQTMNLPR